MGTLEAPKTRCSEKKHFLKHRRLTLVKPSEYQKGDEGSSEPSLILERENNGPVTVSNPQPPACGARISYTRQSEGALSQNPVKSGPRNVSSVVLQNFNDYGLMVVIKIAFRESIESLFSIPTSIAWIWTNSWAVFPSSAAVCYFGAPLKLTVPKVLFCI